MKSSIRSSAVLGFALIATVALAASIPSPPETARGTAVDTVQGVKIADPYRWLENWDDPKVQAWSDAQNTRTRGYLDAIAGRDAVKAELTRLISATSPSFAGLEARGKAVFGYYSDPKFQQPMIVTLNADADPDSRKILIDPNAVDASGHTAIDWFVASPDGSRIAVSLSKNGSEDGTLYVYDVASGKEIDTPIPRVQYPTAGGSVAWAKDSKAFWYTRFPGDDTPEADRHFFQQVYFHMVGSDAKNDKLVLATKDGLPRTAEVFLDNTSGLSDVLASVQLGDGGEWQHFVLRENGNFVQVAKYEDKIVAATLGTDAAVYGISRKDALNGKVMKLSAPYTGGFAAAKVIVPESAVAIVSDDQTHSLTLTGKRLFVRDIVGGPSQLRVFDHDGGHGANLQIPDIAAVDNVVALKTGDVIYGVSSYLRPRYYAKWAAKSGQSTETKMAVTSPVKFDDCEVARVFATSKDGTKVPLNIIRKKGTKLDGSHPTLLYGYGGYGVNMTPGFLGAMRRLWIDAGGVYVVANIRGGGEYGEKWHQQGMLTAKQNVFDDFDAAAEYLISQHYTTHDRLALLGGSNGGLLMGATLTQHPDLAKAVVSFVGIYDMVRVELDPNGSFNTTEFGTVKDPAQFKALYAYSPYHHVAKGTAYPAVLMSTGATDGRVNPMHSRKMMAALQAATSSDRPILLRTNRTAGHGIGSSLSARIEEQADTLTFLFDQLGMTWSPVHS
ncbi:MAG: S9 family peptidase [Proteobacteria bacterium]|nr:S9 family peptidase [Pseudomonadota bacterium]